MIIQRLPAEEAAVRRYAEELWMPYNRDLETIVDAHALAEGVDIVAEQVPWALEKLESDGYRIEVAVDTPAEAADNDVDFADIEGALVGFIATDRDESPSVFEWQTRLLVCEIYVREPFRGTSLARDLMECAQKRARAEAATELVLDVDADNERALAFYEKLGFEPLRHRMRAGVEAFDAPE